ncbi:hypothetical protein [Sphingomonas montana]|uniref:hypothetical protein n=1 Tax=Sphingomonas montana TaxID=1843236 RepID=UPI00101ADA57|nr:hypothetical protein [Sphingomonas montana]
MLPLIIHTAALAVPAGVRLSGGNIQYRDPNGNVRQLTQGGNFTDPVLSSDGHTIAFIHLDGRPAEEGEAGFTSLWIADAVNGTQRRLLASHPNDEPSRNLASFGSPRFSLDGGFIYIDADAWTTSSAVHQISVTTGKERFVVAGNITAIMRTGPYRGYLLVSQHKYRQAPEFGSYEAISLIKPDGTPILVVPGSDGDDSAAAQVAWLNSNGWRAW